MRSEPRGGPTLAALVTMAAVIGAAAFGGGYAAIAHMKRIVVDEKRWISADAFVERVGVAAALPGTTITNLCVLMGYELKGVAAALVAPAVFITPGCGLVALLAVFYDRLHEMAWVRAALDGLNPAVAGLFAAVAVDVGKTSIKRPREALMALLALLSLSMKWLTLLEVVALAGAAGVAFARPRNGAEGPSPLFAALPFGAAVGVASAGLVVFGVFARISVATFGGGIAMVPAMEQEALSRGWIDARVFADAVAIGQLTPGPVATMATFVGYRAAGGYGALAATVGIFAPTIAIALAVARSLSAFRASAVVQGFLRGLGPAVTGILAAAAVAVGRAAVHGWGDAAVLLGCVALRLALPRSTPLLPLVLGALFGLLRARFR